MKKVFQIYVFGEILWDLLPSGKKLGGAPANFAYHANILGGQAWVKSRIGNDSFGAEVQSILASHNISLDFVEIDPVLPTGTVVVHLNENGQPSYEIVENVAWDNIQSDNKFLADLKNADAFYFGSLAARSENNLRILLSLLNSLPEKSLKVFDLNLRNPFYSKEIIRQLLKKTTVFKLNDEELLILAEMFADEIPTTLSICDSLFTQNSLNLLETKVIEWIRAFIQYYQLKHLILTCGSSGSFLWDSQGNSSFAPAEKVNIIDTVGAGDSFTAVCVLGLLKNIPLDKINRNANRYASFICSQSGAMPTVPNQFLDFE
ncbi:MAG: carbohydrate kinase [Planctomycetia bacterium]|nr:carbohydrate kinase [Planctomycetia bacterium]